MPLTGLLRQMLKVEASFCEVISAIMFLYWKCLFVYIVVVALNTFIIMLIIMFYARILIMGIDIHASILQLCECHKCLICQRQHIDLKNCDG
jgi:hypothetical protein